MTTDDAKPPTRAWIRIAATGTIVVASFVGLASYRAVSSGEAALASADLAIRQGQQAKAISEAGRAARAYAPGAPHVPAAYRRLVHLARTSEVSLERDRALLAWREIRQSALDTRWLVQPHARELEMANDAIARLSADDPRAPMARDTSPDEITARARQLLSEDLSSRRGWIAVLLVGLCSLVVGGLGLLSSVSGGRAFRASGVLVGVGFFVYAVAVVRL